MMSKKMAELEDDFREFKAHTKRRFVSLDMSIRAYRLEDKYQRYERRRFKEHEERIAKLYDEQDTVLVVCLNEWRIEMAREDGLYFTDESGLNKKPLCRSNLNVHLQFHVDRLETGSQVKTWDPGIKFVRSNTLRTSEDADEISECSQASTSIRCSQSNNDMGEEAMVAYTRDEEDQQADMSEAFVADDKTQPAEDLQNENNPGS
ncbi:hypothetical protein Tco_1443112, partial [Tanacetum coccineum]